MNKNMSANTMDNKEQSLIMSEYLDIISNKCATKIPSFKDKEKIDDDNISIPKFSEYELLYKNNYNVNQLKSFAKNYKLKVTGNKPQLVIRLFTFLFLSHSILKVQQVFRGHLVRKYNNCHGPAAIERSLCTNDTDFYSMDDVKDLPIEQFFSFKDEDGFIYGFDLLSIYNLVYKCNGVIKNPYNRHPIGSKVIENLKLLLRLSKVLKIPICTEIKDISLEVSCKKSLELRILALFQNIDALGNYSDSKWFLNLNRNQLVRLLRELIDIWTYRANLSEEVKRDVCPPVGNPFGRLSVFSQVQHSDNLDDIRKYLLELLEKFVNTGVNRDSKSLGAYYVLGALTLVSTEAANALPWLYQAVNYNL